MLQLQEPAFNANDQWAVDYGLPEWPWWLSFVAFDFEQFELSFEARYWIFMGLVALVCACVAWTIRGCPWLREDVSDVCKTGRAKEHMRQSTEGNLITWWRVPIA